MNNLNLLLSFLVASVQLADAYLRYLAFRKQISPPERRTYWQRLLLWTILILPVYAFAFRTLETAAAYKLLLLAGWIPYLAIFMGSLRRMVRQHIYVFGMSALWSLMQHNWSSILVAVFLPDSNDLAVILVHGTLYLLWFLVLLSWEKWIFSRLLPCPEVLDELPLGNFLALLPTVLMAPPFLMLADGRLWHSWEERLSRLYLPLVFFALYRYQVSAAHSFHEFAQRKRKAQILREEIVSIRDDATRKQQELTFLKDFENAIIRDCRTLETMLLSGQRQKALALVEERTNGIQPHVLKKFSDAPLVNAAISIYQTKADAIGLSFRTKVNLPAPLQVEESDLAVLLSNLLENAMEAAKQENRDKRGISLTVQHDGKKCVLSTLNPCTRPLRLGDDGLPMTERSGHGTGMVSLKMFLEKYEGYTAFTQEDGCVRLLMYWRDETPCK